MATNEDTELSQYVPGFRANLNLAPQQTTTRIIPYVDADLSYSEPGQMFNADDVGPTDPEDIQSRIPDTPNKFLKKTRRVGMFGGFHDSYWIDNRDKARELEDPSSVSMQSLMAGKNRKMDSTVLAGAIGNAYAKLDDGANLTAVALPAGQIVAVNDVSRSHDAEVVPTGGQDYGLSVGKLIHAKEILDDSDLEGERNVTVGPQQLSDMLRRTPATSSYYAEVKALVAGTLDRFLEFNIIRVPRKRLPFVVGHDTVSPNHQLVAWIKPALIYKARPIVTARVTERADKSYRVQAYYETEHGICRRYDEAVVRIDCYEGPAY